MAAGKYDTVIEQGTNWSLIISLKKPNKFPFDLTGYQAKASVKKNHQDTEALATPVAVILDPPTDGKIQLTLDYTITQDLIFTNGVYDVVLKAPSGQVIRVVQGSVRFSPQVTEWS